VLKTAEAAKMQRFALAVLAMMATPDESGWFV
jgi:hypothetical protein